MNRKKFIGASGLLLGGPFSFLAPLAKEVEKTGYLIPPYLKPGDVVGITAPAGFITAEDIAPAMKIMQNWGYQIKLGNTIGKKDGSFGGTDEERAADFQQMLDNPQVNAIMCARGGYGCVRMIDKINWNNFKKHPKWVIGFSDVTVMHNHIHRQCEVASLHSKMCNSFPADWAQAEPVQVETINSIQEALAGKKMMYTVTPHQQNKYGEGIGVLVGGNLSVMQTLSGTASDIDTDGKILFLEDTGEYLYSIDRMCWHLKRTGKLKALKALVIGGFKVKPDDEGEAFGRTVMDIVLNLVKEYNYPVCFCFPVGHQRANFALKCGVRHQLVVHESEVYMREL